MQSKKYTSEGIYNLIKKKPVESKDVKEMPSITIEDVREWVKQLEESKKNTREVSGWYGGVPFNTGTFNGMDAVIKAYPEIWGKAFKEASDKMFSGKKLESVDKCILDEVGKWKK
jgi:hypothetical protein